MPIQALSDDEEKHREALSRFEAMRGKLAADTLSADYEAGLEVSILWMAHRLKDANRVNEQIDLLLKRPNQHFIAIEQSDSTSRPGFVFLSWLEGYTHPHVHTGFILPTKVAKADSPRLRADLWRKAAKWWHSYEFGRLNSSSGMSYGDRPIEHIFYDKELPLQIKMKMLERLLPKVTGSSLGNARYCLSVLHKKAGNSGKARTYVELALETFSALDQSKHHYHEMAQLCRKALRQLGKE